MSEHDCKWRRDADKVVNAYSRQVADLKRELNEARTELLKCATECRQFEHQMHLATNERDEARAELAEERSARSRCLASNEKLQSERDEALTSREDNRMIRGWGSDWCPKHQMYSPEKACSRCYQEAIRERDEAQTKFLQAERNWKLADSLCEIARRERDEAIRKRDEDFGFQLATILRERNEAKASSDNWRQTAWTREEMWNTAVRERDEALRDLERANQANLELMRECDAARAQVEEMRRERDELLDALSELAARYAVIGDGGVAVNEIIEAAKLLAKKRKSVATD